MKKMHDRCAQCGVRFGDIGTQDDRYCRRCGGPTESEAVAERQLSKKVICLDSLILLAAAFAIYFFPR
jgi:hypothetical protein